MSNQTADKNRFQTELSIPVPDCLMEDIKKVASFSGMSIEDLRITPAREVAHRSIGRAAAERAWSDGRSMQLEEAITAARSLRLVSHG